MNANKRPAAPVENPLFAAAFALLAGVLGFAYFWFYRQYPYYFIWDMDHTVAVDSVLLQSGSIPAHIHHPGFGLYLLLKMSRAAPSLDGLGRSLNPLFCMAELTDFLRAHSPVLALLIALALWLSATLAFGPASSATALLLLAYLGFQTSLFYHATMIRTELYALFYWSLAMLAAAWAARQADWRRAGGGLLVSGLMLGLAYLTKLQAFFHLFAAPLAFYWARGGRPAELPASAKPWIRGGALGAAAAFAYLMVGGALVDLPGGVAVFTKDSALNFAGMFFIAAAAVLALLRADSKLWPLRFVFAGFVLAFSLHFLIVADPRLAHRYMLCDVKVLFFRRGLGPEATSLGEAASAYAAALAQNFFTYAGAPVLAFFAGRGQKGAARWAPLALAGLGLLSVTLGTRSFFRDLIWHELLMSWLLAASAPILMRTPGLPRRGAALVVLSALAWNAFAATTMRPRLDAHYTQYGWSRERLARGVYPGLQDRYEEALNRAYEGGPPPSALETAGRYAEAKREASGVFVNQRIPLDHIGLLAPRFRAWVEEPGWRIAGVPPELSNAILVDNLRLPVRWFLLIPSRVRAHSEAWNKLRPNSTGDVISVLPRPDLLVYYFSDSPEDASSRLKISLTDEAGRRLVLGGREISTYGELRPNPKIRGFFALRGKPL